MLAAFASLAVVPSNPRLAAMTGIADTDPHGWGALMSAAQAGEAAPYRRLLAELRPWLLRYFARRLPPSAVEDAVQDTLVAIHAKRHTWDPARPFGPWLAGIARYKWIDRLRSAGRHAADALPETLSTPDHEAAVTSAAALRGLMATLKPAQAEVIRLVKIDGLSIEEAAARTGQSVALVKVNIHRGLGRLARLVEGSNDAD
ncbi:sigma-70 family RNA polymerase sigma factor [Sandarakinorhabdus sp. DWP1-3-1]|uniref:sigma-70 family RNA polymerase sigma factor n=1 Tax=Sandarakinorhabdus sp. DWP1-3-1 TaxID=2804627 RepID=UPI003CEBB7AD